MVLNDGPKSKVQDLTLELLGIIIFKKTVSVLFIERNTLLLTTYEVTEFLGTSLLALLISTEALYFLTKNHFCTSLKEICGI